MSVSALEQCMGGNALLIANIGKASMASLYTNALRESLTFEKTWFVNLDADCRRRFLRPFRCLMLEGTYIGNRVPLSILAPRPRYVDGSQA
jgi:hypothetical protein